MRSSILLLTEMRKSSSGTPNGSAGVKQEKGKDHNVSYFR